MSAPAQEQLVTRLYGIHQQIFDGVDRATFRKYVIVPGAKDCRLETYADEHGRLVGYVIGHSVRRRVDGKRLVIGRFASGFLPAYRGRTLIGRFMAAYLLRMYFFHPRRRVLVFLAPIGPGTFLAASRTLAEYWPRPSAKTPASVEQLMGALADGFGLQPAASGRPGVRQVGWRLRLQPGEGERWAQSDHPIVRHYLTHNPAYLQGEGLLMLCPIHLRNISSGLQRLARTWRR